MDRPSSADTPTESFGYGSNQSAAERQIDEKEEKLDSEECVCIENNTPHARCIQTDRSETETAAAAATEARRSPGRLRVVQPEIAAGVAEAD